MRNVKAINLASAELNRLLSFFSSDTDRESIEIAMRHDSRGAYQLMDRSPRLPASISAKALNLGLRLGYCLVRDRIGKTLFLEVFSPGKGPNPAPMGQPDNNRRSTISAV